MNDFDYQLKFVCESVERILAQINLDPYSPLFGCAHLSYWRDKTSEVADMRRQEVMLPLAMLFARTYSGSRWKGNSQLLKTVEALLSFWCRHRHADGALDEWYQGERAFAASAFSVFAVARTLHELGDLLPAGLSQSARRCLSQSGEWLCGRDDLFKTNHQAVGVAALAWAGRVLDREDFVANARAKLGSILAAQTPEGWFPELGHFDPGYTFLTVEYLAMAMDLWGDYSALQPLKRAFEFASQWLHPDLTMGPEYGSCHNPYVSRIAAALMAPHCAQAAFLAQKLATTSNGGAGLAPTLHDDLRLLRWAFQPLLAHEYAQRLSGREPNEPLPLLDADASNHYSPTANLARLNCAGAGAIFAPVAGGLLRLFGREGKSFSDEGYAIAEDNNHLVNLCHDPNLAAGQQNQRYWVRAPLTPVRPFLPPYWARVALHLMCSTAQTSRWTRKGIDFFRKRKGTALNQSSANITQSDSKTWLERSIEPEDDRLLVLDRLKLPRGTSSKQVFWLRAQDSNSTEQLPLSLLFPELPPELDSLTITRVYSPADGWRLAEASARPQTV